MTIEESFRANMAEWRGYCNEKEYSPRPEDYLDCDAYRNLVALGHDALPLIYWAGKTESAGPLDLCISCLVGDIAGEEFHVPEHISSCANLRHQYALNWIRDRLGDALFASKTQSDSGK